MNESGPVVGPARGSYHLPLDQLLVIHDEIDLPFGEIQERHRWGSRRPQRAEERQPRGRRAGFPARPRRGRPARLDRPGDRLRSRAVALLRARARRSRAGRARRRLRPARRRALTDYRSVSAATGPSSSLPGHQAPAGRCVRRAPTGGDALARDRPARERSEWLLRDRRSRFRYAGAGIRRVQPAARQADRPPRTDAGARQLRDRIPDLGRRADHGGGGGAGASAADCLRGAVRNLLPAPVRGAASTTWPARRARRPDRVGVRARGRDAGALLHLRTAAGRRARCSGVAAGWRSQSLRS